MKVSKKVSVNVDGMGLEAAGVKFNAAGVETDDYLRTTNPAAASKCHVTARSLIKQ